MLLLAKMGDIVEMILIYQSPGSNLKDFQKASNIKSLVELK